VLKRVEDYSLKSKRLEARKLKIAEEEKAIQEKLIKVEKTEETYNDVY